MLQELTLAFELVLFFAVGLLQRETQRNPLIVVGPPLSESTIDAACVGWQSEAGECQKRCHFLLKQLKAFQFSTSILLVTYCRLQNKYQNQLQSCLAPGQVSQSISCWVLPRHSMSKAKLRNRKVIEAESGGRNRSGIANPYPAEVTGICMMFHRAINTFIGAAPVTDTWPLSVMPSSCWRGSSFSRAYPACSWCCFWRKRRRGPKKS